MHGHRQLDHPSCQTKKNKKLHIQNYRSQIVHYDTRLYINYKRTKFNCDSNSLILTFISSIKIFSSVLESVL